MPYCEPHRAARAHIVDLEILRLELRAGAARRRVLAGTRAASAGVSPTHGSTPPRT
jgi:hypothetical protein